MKPDPAKIDPAATVDAPILPEHPTHYTQGSMECIDAIEGLELSFHAGNVVKYVARYKHKGGVEDLKKARWYLDRLIVQETRRMNQ